MLSVVLVGGSGQLVPSYTVTLSGGVKSLGGMVQVPDVVLMGTTAGARPVLLNRMPTSVTEEKVPPPIRLPLSRTSSWTTLLSAGVVRKAGRQV